MNSNKPLVSVIVPVYNSEKYLRRCLDSIVYQTLKEIEIICVNNGSEDTSLDILNEYLELFPEKIVVHTIEHHPRAGHGRNVGMHLARADYIAFCDSDDMIYLRALELMYSKAMSQNCDLVVAPHWRVQDRKISIGGRISHKENITVEDLILSASPSVWAKLIHKNLIDKVGDMPEHVSAEDIPYSYMLHTYAKKIAYVDVPVYYYINRSTSEVRKFLSPNLYEGIEALDYGVSQSLEDYKYELISKNGDFMKFFIGRNWVFADKYIANLKKLWIDLKDSEFFKEHFRHELPIVEKYVALTDEPMDTVVYISGFGGVSEERVEYIKEKAFYGGAQVIVLDENNCDINENETVKSAYSNGNFDFVSKYFAIQEIYKTGGVFIGNSIKIDAPLNYIRYFPAFFGYIDDSNFTDEIFGGLSGSKVLGLILDTYENGGRYRDKYFPLDKRIKNILSAVYGVSLERARTSIFRYKDFALFSPDIFIVDPSEGLGALFPKMHFTTLDFSKFAEDDSGEYVTVKYSTLRSICANANSSGVNNSLNNQIRDLKTKVKEYETSDSWKITRPLRRFSRTRIGHVFLKFYRWLLKLKRK